MGNTPSSAMEAAAASENSAKRAGQGGESPLPAKRSKGGEGDRRKSRGRKERRSIVDPRMLEARVKELHESVPVDANGAERLKELLQLSLQQAMREAASTVSDPLSETEVKECDAELLELFLAEVEKQGELKAAIEKPALKPNPKNALMEENIAVYTAVRKRLAAEEQIWQRMAETHEPATGAGRQGGSAKEEQEATSVLSAEQRSFLQGAVAEAGADSRSWQGSLTMQIAALEAFGAALEKLQETAQQQAKVASESIASTAFGEEIKDPQALIRGITASAPSEVRTDGATR